jgi:hypothetical protein
MPLPDVPQRIATGCSHVNTTSFYDQCGAWARVSQTSTSKAGTEDSGARLCR